jgi:hypothetical protein
MIRMRKSLLSLFFLCFVYLLKGQQQTLPAFNYTPQAPTTAAFTRYGDIPVDLSTGVTAINIPIYTMSEHGINIPISISYHASGIKVSDVASEVGLGWTLNAGGTVTQTTFGWDDEQVDYGGRMRPQWKSAEEFEDYNFAHMNDPLWNPELYYYHLFTTDNYTDRFYYSLGNGESGIFRKDLATNIFKTIPYKPVKIRFISPVNGQPLKIEIITTDGTRYLYRKNIKDYWSADRIINSSGTDSVVFYSHVAEVTNNNVTYTETFGSFRNRYEVKTEPYLENERNPCWAELGIRNSDFSNGPLPTSTVLTNEIPLTDSIVGANTVIRFTYAQDREDAIFAFSSRLIRIQVFNRLSGTLIKTVDFSHTYSGTTSPFDPSISSRRLMLAGMQSGANGEEKHAFRYNTQIMSNYFRGHTAPGQDLWGYNGLSGSSLLFADFSPGGNNGLFPNEELTKACMLEEIKYPTGGKTVFEYESHRASPLVYGYGFSPGVFPADGKVGGLRIKKISNYAYEGAVPQIKTYEYECTLDRNYGMIAWYKFVYTQKTFYYFNTNGSYAECGYIGGNGSYGISSENICTSNPMGRIIGGPQAQIHYSTVTEYIGEPGNSAGKTVYHYTNVEGLDNDQEYEDLRFIGPWQIDIGSYIPPLKKKEEYKFENGQYKLVRKTETLFTTLHDTEFITGLNLASDLPLINFRSNEPNSYAFDYYNNYLHRYYDETLHYSNTVARTALKLPSKTSIYDYIDDNNYILTSTEYSYNSYCQQISATTTTTSKGELLKTKFTYPVDYPGQAPYNTMVARNNISPVIEQSTFISTNVPEVFLQSITTNYNFWDPASQIWGNSASNFILPQTVETKKGTNDVETRVQYFSYDEKGNPVYVAKENDTRQHYIWDYNKTYPVAQVINVSESDKKYVVYNSFEAVTSWLFGWGSIVDDNTAPTGKKCLFMGVRGLQYALNSNNSYILSYWYKAGSSISVAANSTILANPAAKNGWVFMKRRITGSSSVSIAGSGYIDELRLYPETAQMATFAYEPGVGVTAQCDINDKITYYQYDAAGRLILVKDDNGYVLKKICYNYQGQVSNCDDNTIPLWQPTGATRCKPCPQNSNYTSNMKQQEERDNNPNSDTYGTVRWVDWYAICTVTADWQNTANTRCVTINNQNTGELQQEQSDRNPCSGTYGQTRWISAGTNTTACPVPLVYRSLPIVNKTYYKQDCGAQQNPLPYIVNLAEGAFTSSNSPQEANALAEQEAQRLANINGGCFTVYIRTATVLKSNPSDEQQYSEITFYFYSDAAGTIPLLTFPSPIIINYKVRDWWTTNGGPPESDGYISYSFPPSTFVDDKFVYEYVSTFCPDASYCWHSEVILLPGRYVIIP